MKIKKVKDEESGIESVASEYIPPSGSSTNTGGNSTALAHNKMHQGGILITIGTAKRLEGYEETEYNIMKLSIMDKEYLKYPSVFLSTSNVKKMAYVINSMDGSGANYDYHLASPQQRYYTDTNYSKGAMNHWSTHTNGSKTHHGTEMILHGYTI